ncbi:MAG: hypothetical protein C0449_15355 [Polaromonas sp.]|nr:hypothetical protein [Polaromonas sp.]
MSVAPILAVFCDFSAAASRAKSAFFAWLASLTTSPRRSPSELAMAPQPIPESRSPCTLLVAAPNWALVGLVMPCLARSALAMLVAKS